MHVGPEGMYEQRGPTQDVHTSLHLEGERVTADFLQAIRRSHTTMIASAVKAADIHLKKTLQTT
jgi:hypothetical protein